MPALIFDETDQLWPSYQRDILGIEVGASPSHWLPSSHGFVEMLLSHTVCALVPRIQVKQELKEGALLDLFPDKVLKVPLYWHWCGLESELLDELTTAVIAQANHCLN